MYELYYRNREVNELVNTYDDKGDAWNQANYIIGYATYQSNHERDDFEYSTVVYTDDNKDAQALPDFVEQVRHDGRTLCWCEIREVK